MLNRARLRTKKRLVYPSQPQLRLDPRQQHLVQAVCSRHLQDERDHDVIAAADVMAAEAVLAQTSQALCLPIEQILRVAVVAAAEQIVAEHGWTLAGQQGVAEGVALVACLPLENLLPAPAVVYADVGVDVDVAAVAAGVDADVGADAGEDVGVEAGVAEAVAAVEHAEPVVVAFAATGVQPVD